MNKFHSLTLQMKAMKSDSFTLILTINQPWLVASGFGDFTQPTQVQGAQRTQEDA